MSGDDAIKWIWLGMLPQELGNKNDGIYKNSGMLPYG